MFGGGDSIGGPQPKTDRRQLNDLFNSDPNTQFLGPTPTATPTPQDVTMNIVDVLQRMGLV